MGKMNPLTLGFALLCLTLPAIAQQPIVYPAKGQSAAQQNADEAECHGWARQSTGIDPAVVAQTPPPAAAPPPPPAGPAVGGGERLRGAARGAAGGAIIGEIVNDDAGKGAGVGAVVGTMAGGARARQNLQAQAQAQQQQQLDTFNRAMSACMEGRGYTIK